MKKRKQSGEKNQLLREDSDSDEQAFMNISSHLQKSYVFQNAAKKIPKKKLDQILQENQNDHIRETIRATQRFHPSPLTISTCFKDKTNKQYKLFVQNLGKTNNSQIICGSCDNNSSREAICQIGSDLDLEIYEKNKNNSQKKLIYYISFNAVYASVQEQSSLSKNDFLLRVNKHLILQFSSPKSPENLQKFKKELKLMIQNSQGVKYQIKSLSESEKCNDFFKCRYKSAVQFADQCQTGDILLFRGSHLFGKIQRLFTNSQYDHVGMIIKDPTYGVLIFQSTGNSGVCLASWDYMVRDQLYKYTQEFVWRKLTGVERNFQFQKLIHNFVKQNLHKKYFISIQKLMANTSKLNTNNQPEKDGYFCSELVAKMYKSLNLLPNSTSDSNYKASNNFYPYHFTQKHKLPFIRGQLSEEYKIHFDEKQIRNYYKKF